LKRDKNLSDVRDFYRKA